MNAQRTSGRRAAAWIPAAALALALGALPVGPASAAPASGPQDSATWPLGISISALWQQLSGWMGIAPERDRPARPGRAAVFAAPDPEPADPTRRDGLQSSYRRCEGEDGYKLDPMG